MIVDGQFLLPQYVSNFTYSKKSHFKLFDDFNYDLALFGEKFIPENFTLKRYQDLIVFSFIGPNIPKGSKLLEIGGGHSRIIQFFKKDYECWNIDKLEGIGQGPLKIKQDDFFHVKDYMGNFNKALKKEYFDLVFSISVLEHVKEDTIVCENILNDIRRVLKIGGYSLHCLDSKVKEKGHHKPKRILEYFFDNIATLNHFIPFDDINDDNDLFFLSKDLYEKIWRKHTKMSYEEFGRPFSYNIFWRN